MEWSADGGVSNPPGQGQNTCPSCGSSNLEEDTAHAMVVCQDCGVAIQGQFTEHYHFPSFSQPSAERSREQIRVFSAKEYPSKKLGKLIQETKKVAAAAKLSKAETDICIDQAKELNRRGSVGRKCAIEKVAAVLIFTSWKRKNPAISASDMWSCTGVKPHALLKATKLLCEEHPDMQLSVSETVTQSVTDEQRLIQKLDRFPTLLTAEERKRVLTVAQDIWSLVVNVKVQDTTLRKRVPINDYCILIVAVENVKRQKFPKTDLAKLAENLNMTDKSVHTRVWRIKTALVSLAALSPTLGEDVKQKVISTQNVERFLDRLILNKEFLVTELESLEGDGEEEEGCSSETKRKKTKRPRRSRRKSPTGPKVLASDKVRPDGMVEGENENLSDLDGDIEEYILNEKEVEARKQFIEETTQ